MEDFEEIMNAFSELDFSKMSFGDTMRCVNMVNALYELTKELVIKYSFDTPSKSTFLFKMGDD